LTDQAIIIKYYFPVRDHQLPPELEHLRTLIWTQTSAIALTSLSQGAIENQAQNGEIVPRARDPVSIETDSAPRGEEVSNDGAASARVQINGESQQYQVKLVYTEDKIIETLVTLLTQLIRIRFAF